MYRARDQVRVDRGRKTYKINFPTDMRARDFHSWMGSVFGILRANGLAAPPNMAFEVWASTTGMTHRLKVPEHVAADIASQLRTLVPGINLQEDDEPLEHDWTVWFEYKETHKARTLSMPDPEIMSARMVGSFQDIQDGEEVLFQAVVTSARNESPPKKQAVPNHWLLKQILGAGDDTEDRAAKLREANVNAVFRVAVRAKNVPRAKQLARNINNRFEGIGNASNQIVRRTYADKHKMLERVRHASGMTYWPIKLTLTEFISLVVWPIGSPHVAGYAAGLPRQLPPAPGIPSKGTVLGTANFSGSERRLAIADEAGSRHTWCIGGSGQGKTSLLTNIAVQRINKGEGLFVIESKRDLFYAVLDRIPEHRKGDVVVIDVDDSDMPVGFNLLNQGTSRNAVDQLSQVISSIYGNSNGLVNAPMLLYHGLHALASVPGHTFVDLPALLTPQGPEESYWRQELVGKIPDKNIRLFWQRYLMESRDKQDNKADSLHNRLWQLVTRPEVRNIFGQTSSRFSVADAIRDKKIVLIFLNERRVGEDTAGIVGTILFNEIWSQIRTVEAKHRTTLMLDEFQDFMRFGVNAEQMLAQARAFNADLILAHQNIGQVDRQLIESVMANAGTKIAFKTSARDAGVVAREFGKLVTEEDIANREQREAVARVMMTNHSTSPPVTLRTLEVAPVTGLANEIRWLSREKYGTPVSQVEAEMEARRKPKDKPKKTPTNLGSADWQGGKR